MSGLILTLKASPPDRLDLATLQPAALAALGLAEIERLPLRLGAREVALAELFSVQGNAGDTLTLRDADRRLDRVGAGLAQGTIRVEGDLGFYAGENMTGGALNVDGSLSGHGGLSMAGGVLKIGGDAGDFLGSGRPGLRHGMADGVILVKGSAGMRTGDRMRRGLILVDGALGAFAGSRMLAGTIAAAGGLGADAGFAMRRGTLITRGSGFVPLASFAYAGSCELGFLELFRRRVAPLGSWLSHARHPMGRNSRYIGDRAADGRGEIVILEG